VKEGHDGQAFSKIGATANRLHSGTADRRGADETRPAPCTRSPCVRVKRNTDGRPRADVVARTEFSSGPPLLTDTPGATLAR